MSTLAIDSIATESAKIIIKWTNLLDAAVAGQNILGDFYW
jgi:hypothetical protein